MKRLVLFLLVFFISVGFSFGDFKIEFKDEDGYKFIKYLYLANGEDVDVKKFDKELKKDVTPSPNQSEEENTKSGYDKYNFLNITYSYEKDKYRIVFNVVDDIIIDDENDIMPDEEKMDLGEIVIKYIFDDEEYTVKKQLSILNKSNFNMVSVSEDTAGRFIKEINNSKTLTIKINDDSGLPLKYTYDVENLNIK